MGAGASRSPGAAEDCQSRSCIFCTLPKAYPERVLYQDNELFAMYDRRPSARLHVLVCPLEHIPNTRSLRGPPGADLVRRMQQVGQQVLAQEQARLGLPGEPAADADGSGSGRARRPSCCERLFGRRRGPAAHDGGRGGAARGLLEESGEAQGPDAEASGLDGAGGGTLFGFHKPPWRSVDHLHMHCFLLPLDSGRAWKYRFSLNWVTAEELQEQLQRQEAAAGPNGGNRGV